MFRRLLPLLLLVAACRRDVPTVHQTSSGQLVLGEAEVLGVLDRRVDLGGRTLVLEGFNGTLDLTGAGAGPAELHFTRRARGSDDAEAAAILEGVSVTEAGDGGAYRFTMRADDPSLTAVDVRGTVPRGTAVRVRLATGTVTVRATGGAVDIDLENGTVEVSGAAAPVNVQARNATLDVDVALLRGAAPVAVETQNGSVALGLPLGASASITAVTHVGTISDAGLPFTQPRLVPEGAGARFFGRLGAGAARVTVQTQNGALTLRPSAPLPPVADTLAARPMRLVPPDSSRGALPLPPVRDTARLPPDAAAPDSVPPAPRRPGAR